MEISTEVGKVRDDLKQVREHSDQQTGEIKKDVDALSGLVTKTGQDLTTRISSSTKPGDKPSESRVALRVQLFDPEAPVIQCENLTDATAEKIGWELIMFRESDFAFFSYPMQDIGYIKPHSKGARYSMDLNRLPRGPGSGEIPTGDQLRTGDIVMGMLSVDCPSCLGITFVVRFVWGSEGWFYELPEGKGQFYLPSEMTKTGVHRYIQIFENLRKPEERTSISSTPKPGVR